MLKHWKQKAEESYKYAFDVVRVFVGVAIFMKGLFFIMNMDVLLKIMDQGHMNFSQEIMARYIGLAHLAGGVLLVIGMLTRLAAAVQIPVLLGAIFMVHMREGFFSSSSDLEYVVLLLIIHIVLAVVGGGPLSVDAMLVRDRKEGTNDSLIAFRSHHGAAHLPNRH